QALTDLFTMGGHAPTDVTLVGRKFHKLTLPADEPIDFVWSSGNGYLLAGFGAGAMEEMSARIRAQKEPAWLTQLKSNLPVERRSTISYVNIKKIVDTFLPLGGPEADKIVTALGLKQVTSFQGVTGLDKNGLYSRSLLAIEPPASGILKLLDENGIDSAD